MSEIGHYITVTITLLGVAYPILLQVIAKLDERYSSDRIIKLFYQEIERKLFLWLLICTLIFIVLWTIELEPLFQLDGLNFIVNNSASILVVISTIGLVIAFFFFTKKMLIYYTPTEFTKYLIKKYKKTSNDIKKFNALSDILLISIKQQWGEISLTLSGFFYDAFRYEREKFPNTPVEYPEDFYVVVYRAIEELAILKEKRNYSLEYRTAGSIWLLGEMQGHEISAKTYTWLWRNILLSVRYQQDDLIVYHWETANQFFAFNLPVIYENIDISSGTVQVANQEEINKRSAEREKFIEFHYALGGVLTFKKRYNCIRRIFDYTNSQPPQYELLPESMYEIFNFYDKVRDPFDHEYEWISSQYPFPEQNGLNADSVVKNWICSYMAILFLRQYSIVPHLGTMDPLDFPAIPETQSEIKNWIDGLDFFKRLVSEHLGNRELLVELNLQFITQEWCKENDRVYPIDFIDEFKFKLQKDYNNNALTLPISEEKVKQFESATRKSIESVMEEISMISNSNEIEGEVDKWYVNGQKMIQSKDAFSANPEVDYLNFDSILATVLSRRIVDLLASTFLIKKTKTYLFKYIDFFNAIDKLELNSNHVIVAFGVNIEYYINEYKITGLNQEKYKETEIYSFSSPRIVHNSIFILRKSDLPFISTKQISDEIIQKYSLERISEKLNLFSSIIDLNRTSKEIYDECKQGRGDEEIKKSVLMSIIISVEFLWKKKIEVIQLNEFSEYKPKGLLNELNEIEPFEKRNPG